MLSSNAPFDNKGFAQVIRDLERHELLLSGSRNGDMGTSTGLNIGPQSAQDQSIADDAMGGSPVATLADLEGYVSDEELASLQSSVDSLQSSVRDITFPIPVSRGGTSASTASVARTNLGLGSMAVVNSPAPIANGGTAATTRGGAANALYVPKSGTATLYTSGTGTFTVPAGVYGLWVMCVGGGGGGSSKSTTTTLGFVAASSGGAVTTSLDLVQNGGAGGGGGAACIWLTVSPGDTITYSVGAGGANSTTTFGANGGSSTATYSAAVLVGGGGAGGGPGNSLGGYGGLSVGGASTLPDASGPSFSMFGAPGESGGLSIGGVTFRRSANTTPGIYIGSNSYGSGGASGAAGTSGCVMIWY